MERACVRRMSGWLGQFLMAVVAVLQVKLLLAAQTEGRLQSSDHRSDLGHRTSATERHEPDGESPPAELYLAAVVISVSLRADRRLPSADLLACTPKFDALTLVTEKYDCRAMAVVSWLHRSQSNLSTPSTHILEPALAMSAWLSDHSWRSTLTPR